MAVADDPRIVHSLPGRVRINAPGIADVGAASVVEAISRVDGIRRCWHNMRRAVGLLLGGSAGEGGADDRLGARRAPDELGRAEGRLNSSALGAVGGSLVVLAGTVVLPPLRAFLGLSSPSLVGVAIAGGASALAAVLGRVPAQS
jgi:hypothetical protein